MKPMKPLLARILSPKLVALALALALALASPMLPSPLPLPPLLAPAAAFASPAGALGVDGLLQDMAAPITRGEFAMLLNAYLSLPEGAGDGFLDVPAGHPYAADISTAQAVGYMKGDGDGAFRPDDTITGAEAAVCVNFFLGFDPEKVEPDERAAVPPWAVADASNLIGLSMATPELACKEVLAVADAVAFADALLSATMFQGGPYALSQASEKDDFFAYTNRQYLATAKIPAGYIFAMAFFEPEISVQAQSAELLAGILAEGGEPGSDEWKISELHKMYMDEAGRAASIEKARPIIDEIMAVDSIAGLNALSARLFPTLNLQSFYGISAYSDAKADATNWCAIVLPGGFILGSRDYYADDASLAPLHEATTKFIADVLAYGGETDGLRARAEAVFEIEKGNALASMPTELLNDPDVIYTKSSWAEMDRIASGSGAMGYSPELREALEQANVYCPDIEYVKHVESLYTEANLGALKDFAAYNVLVDFGGVLGDDFSELQKGLQAALFGEAVETPSMEQRAQTLITSLMDDAFSKLYADKHSSPSIKADVTQIVELIRAKYRERIAGLGWMGEETKQNAIEKLDAVKAYVAYPDSYKTKYSFDVMAKADGGNLVDFYMDYVDSIFQQQLDSIKEPFARNLWDSVQTYTVNAFYSASENAIIIPAGILQEPFYSKDAEREANLGALGAIIAHEFSHAFDNSGAKYDKDGTIANWWAEADYAAFDGLAGEVAAALSGIDFVGGQHVNGVLCTGETIADLGAIACILDIADDTDGADMALAMRSWARIWAARMSPEVAAFLLSMDTHAPHKTRVNFVLPMYGDFYEAFGVTEADGMYVAPEDRITIW